MHINGRKKTNQWNPIYKKKKEKEWNHLIKRKETNLMMQVEGIKVKFNESIDEVTETLKLKWEKNY